MEFLSAVTMFNSAFLGLTASLIGFLLLALWGGMLVWGVKVERPLYKMLGIVFASIGISMLFGLYESGTEVQAFPGGVLGHWVGERCAAIGMVGFSCFLLWLAVPAGLLLATDWFFVGFFFGGRGPVPVTGGLGAAFSKSIRIFSSSEGEAGRQGGSEKGDPKKGSILSFLGRSLLGFSGRYRRSPRDLKAAPRGGRRASDRRGLGHARPKAVGAPDVSPAVVEEEINDLLDSGSSVALADEEDGNVADIAADSVVTKGEENQGVDPAAWWKSETLDEPSSEKESAPLAECDDPIEPVVEPDGEVICEEEVVLEKSWWTAPSEWQSEEENLPEPELENTEPELESTVPDVESAVREIENIESETENVEPDFENVESEVENSLSEVEDSRLECASTVPDVCDEAVEESDLGEEDLEEAEPEEEEPEEEKSEEIEAPVEEAPARESGEIPAEAQRKLSDDPEPQPQTVFSFSGEESPEPAAISDEDIDLFKRAVTLVVEQRKGSISLLQKDLGLGYFKAAKLLTTLEAKGVIAPYAGSIARKVTISEEQAAKIVGGVDPL